MIPLPSLLLRYVLQFAVPAILVPRLLFAPQAALTVRRDPEMLPVIQQIEHSDHAASRDEELTSLQMDIEWADQVQQHVAGIGAVPASHLEEQEEGASMDAELELGEAQSAPAATDTHHCLLPWTLVQKPCNTADYIAVTNLKTGSCIRGGMGIATIRHIETHAKRDRDIIDIHFIEEKSSIQGHMSVTASQQLPVLRQCAHKFAALSASNVQSNDRLRTRSSEAIVFTVERYVVSTEVTAVEFEDRCSTMFVANPTENAVFVEVYGELAPLGADIHVKILHFRRCTNFKQALLDGEALRACRDDLENHGFSSDLLKYNLGPGKLFVDHHMAERTLAALRQRGRATQPSEIIVSRAFEAAVLDAALHIPGGRPNRLHKEELLDLTGMKLWITTDPLHLEFDDCIVVVERTFLHCPPPLPPDARSAVTNSTTDAHPCALNPRAVALRGL